MDAQRHFWDNFHRIARAHWPKVLSPIGILATLLTSLWLTVNDGAQSSVLSWINSILTEVGGGFVEDWLQTRVRAHREPSFQEVWQEVERMKKEEREILERLAIKLNILPVLLNELSERLDQHAASITKELRERFHHCEERVLELQMECLQRLIERLEAQHEEIRVGHEDILKELRQLQALLATMVTHQKKRSRLLRTGVLTDGVIRKIQQEIMDEMGNILNDDIV